ncbi:Aspartate kinase FUB3 [Colletotrichum sp. SAR 10_99]|nr:Aspartate kinase FUB3 [Colletotrichum sp. SAR 10_99]
MSSQPIANTSSNGWVVQKFGGTSVGKFPDKIATDIVRASLAKNKVVVVCSARSTGKKVEGTTSRLLGVYNKLKGIAAATNTEEVQNDLMSQARGLIDDITNDHVSAVKTFIKNPELQASLDQEIRDECQELVEYIVAARRFNLEGVAAEYVDLSDAFHYDASSRLDQSFYQEAATVLRKKISACEDRVPVVTGFFGNVPGSLIDGDIGRGYTDLCAALCAVGLKADELQVWKEVDGIFTADPTKVPTARLLHSITPSEAAELTFYGSEVIHHLTMDQVIHASPPIPIRIKNVKNPRGVGTIVIPDPILTAGHQIQRSKPSDPSLIQKPKRPTAVTIKDKISVINVHSNKRSISHGFFARVFSILDKNQISVDLISTSEVHVSMAIHAGNSEGGSFDRARKELEDCGDVSVLHDMAILSLVGAEMKNMIGIAGRMFSTLGEHNVNLEMISQGASEINISCVIEARDATRAMNILHTNLFTFLD